MDALVFDVEGRIGSADIRVLCERVRAMLEASDADQLVCDVKTLTAPDAVTVDGLARLQLTARRLGRRITLRHACDELRGMLAFAGLNEVLVCVDLILVAEGQSEQREQVRGVEEEADPGDPIA
jgi:STAS domain-containing protein